MTSLLVTGFESYGGASANPSAVLARNLDGRMIAGASITGKILPVSIAQMPGVLRNLMDDLSPDGILLMGQWPGESMIRLERLAINFAEFGIPDNDGAIRTEPVSAAGAPALAATWPARRIERRLLDAGIPARLSEHAGTFLCNASLYTALSHKPAASGLPIGFMHLPYLPQQICELIQALRAQQQIELFQRQDLASMALDMQMHAARLALEEIVASLDRAAGQE